MNKNQKGRSIDNEGVTTSDAKNLQAELYSICAEAIGQARAQGNITPSLITSIHKVVQDAGVQVGSSVADHDHPLWRVVDQLEDFSFLEK